MIDSAFTGTLRATTGEYKIDVKDDDSNDDGRARSQWQVTGQSSPNGRITS
jgi:hypothetical protein